MDDLFMKSQERCALLRKWVGLEGIYCVFFHDQERVNSKSRPAQAKLGRPYLKNKI
jgi:hypothetical protein